MKEDIFNKIKKEKDLTISSHWTIKKSVIEKIKKLSKEKNMSESKIVNTILENFFE